MGHTPGPWIEVIRTGLIGGSGEHYTKMIAVVRSDTMEMDEAEGNAALIKAAPKMLDALYRARDSYRYVIKHMVDERHAIAWRQELAVIEAAIAAAINTQQGGNET